MGEGGRRPGEGAPESSAINDREDHEREKARARVAALAPPLLPLRASSPTRGEEKITRRAEPPQAMTSFAAEGPPNLTDTKERLSTETCGGIYYAGSPENYQHYETNK